MASKAHERFVVARFQRWTERNQRQGWVTWRRFSSFLAAKNAAMTRPCIDGSLMTAIHDTKTNKQILCWQHESLLEKDPTTHVE